MKFLYFLPLFLALQLVLGNTQLAAQTNKTIADYTIDIVAYQGHLQNPNLDPIERRKILGLYEQTQQEIAALGGAAPLYLHIEQDRIKYVSLLEDFLQSNLTPNTPDFIAQFGIIKSLKPRLSYKEEQAQMQRFASPQEYNTWKVFYAQYQQYF